MTYYCSLLIRTFWKMSEFISYATVLYKTKFVLLTIVKFIIIFLQSLDFNTLNETVLQTYRYHCQYKLNSTFLSVSTCIFHDLFKTEHSIDISWLLSSRPRPDFMSVIEDHIEHLCVIDYGIFGSKSEYIYFRVWKS